MKAEAVSVGSRLLEDESTLDRAFVDQTISPDTLVALTAKIGETQGRLGAAHPKYHLTVAALLSADQKHRYTELRGYR